MNATLRNILTGGFMGLGVNAAPATIKTITTAVKIVGFAALVVAGVWIYSKVKK